MPRRPARFTEADIRRAIKAVTKLGVNAYVQVAPDGTITIEFKEPDANPDGGLHKKRKRVV